MMWLLYFSYIIMDRVIFGVFMLGACNSYRLYRRQVNVTSRLLTLKNSTPLIYCCFFSTKIT